MEYKIKYEGRIIAEFVNECDRDICLDALIDAFPDCEDNYKKIGGDEET